jgi:hypothetical protein
MIALLVTLLDQGSKIWIRQCMELHESIPVLPGFFHITYILNKGAAFGILENQRWVFLAIALLLFVCTACSGKNCRKTAGYTRESACCWAVPWAMPWTGFCAALLPISLISVSGLFLMWPISVSLPGWLYCYGIAGPIIRIDGGIHGNTVVGSIGC